MLSLPMDRMAFLLMTIIWIFSGALLALRIKQLIRKTMFILMPTHPEISSGNNSQLVHQICNRLDYGRFKSVV